MPQKIDIPVVINNKVYTLSGYEGDDHLQNVANYVNSKINECKTSESYRKMGAEYQGVFLALNIANDYFEAKKHADNMVGEDEEKDQQIYDLRHQVIDAKIKQDSAMRMVEEYKDQINALQRKIIQLETENKRVHEDY